LRYDLFDSQCFALSKKKESAPMQLQQVEAWESCVIGTQECYTNVPLQMEAICPQG